MQWNCKDHHRGQKPQYYWTGLPKSTTTITTRLIACFPPATKHFGSWGSSNGVGEIETFWNQQPATTRDGYTNMDTQELHTTFSHSQGRLWEANQKNEQIDYYNFYCYYYYYYDDYYDYYDYYPTTTTSTCSFSWQHLRRPLSRLRLPGITCQWDFMVTVWHWNCSRILNQDCFFWPMLPADFHAYSVW